MTIKSVLAKIEAAEKKGGMSPDDKIELSEEITLLDDQVREAFEKLRDLPELLEAPEGKPNPRDEFVDELMSGQRTIKVEG